MSNVEASSLSFQKINCFRTNVPFFYRNNVPFLLLEFFSYLRASPFYFFWVMRVVKNFHIMDLKEILRIGLDRWREIGWGGNQGLIRNVKISPTSLTLKWKVKHFLHDPICLVLPAQV